MENKNMLIVLGILALLVVGYFFISGTSGDDKMSQETETTTTTDTGRTDTTPEPVMEDEMMEEEKMMEAEKTIVDIAVESGDFDTLVAAVQEAGLVETLSGAGPFTVFAPTDEAFAKIPQDTLNAILADKEQLTAILTYHVVAGKVMAADVVELTSAQTVQGQELTVKVMDDGTVMVDNAKVITTDIEASNGVIHVIDTVVLPQ